MRPFFVHIHSITHITIQYNACTSFFVFSPLTLISINVSVYFLPLFLIFLPNVLNQILQRSRKKDSSFYRNLYSTYHECFFMIMSIKTETLNERTKERKKTAEKKSCKIKCLSVCSWARVQIGLFFIQILNSNSLLPFFLRICFGNYFEFRRANLFLFVYLYYIFSHSLCVCVFDVAKGKRIATFPELKCQNIYTLCKRNL